MKDKLKSVGSRALAAGSALVALSLALRSFGLVPESLACAGIAAGSILMIFALGRSTGPA